MSDTKISIEALAAAIRKYAIPKKTYVDYAVKMEEEQVKLRIVSGLTVGEITELLLAGV